MIMKGKRKLFLSVLFVVVITVLFAVPTFAKPTLNKKKATISVGQSVKLRVKGTNKKPKWYSSDKTIASVSKTGVVKGLRAGKVIIKAKVKGKILKCKIVVTSSSDSDTGASSSDSGTGTSSTDSDTGASSSDSDTGASSSDSSTGASSSDSGTGTSSSDSDTRKLYSPKLGESENTNGTTFTFQQDGWYIARLEVQVWDKSKQDFTWFYSDSCARGQKTKLTIDTSRYEINRVGYQIWFFGWNNDYMNIPWATTDFATYFILSGYDDYPDFTWK
jgi:hypothetical protein